MSENLRNFASFLRNTNMDTVKSQQEIIIRYQNLVNQLQKVIEMSDDDVKYYKNLYHQEKNNKLDIQKQLEETNKELFDIKIELIKGNIDGVIQQIRESNL